MQVVDTGNRFLLQQMQKPSDALVCFEFDMLAKIDEQRLIACSFKSRAGALLRGHVRESIPLTRGQKSSGPREFRRRFSEMGDHFRPVSWRIRSASASR